MSSEIAPCPVCGGSARPGIHPGDYQYCGGCTFSASPAQWNRLSRAAALLRAVEGVAASLDTNKGRSILIWHVPVRVGDNPHDVRWVLEISSSASTEGVRDMPLPAALIALAERLEVSDA